MARSQLVVVTDDLDGSEEAHTHRFGLDGVQYEIDLSEGNWRRLTEGLAPFIRAGRKIGQAKIVQRRRAGHAPGGELNASDIRAWLREQGASIGDRGRIPNDLVGAFTRRDGRAVAEWVARHQPINVAGMVAAVRERSGASPLGVVSADLASGPEPAPEVVFSAAEQEPKVNGYKPGATVKAPKPKPEDAKVTEVPSQPAHGQVRRWMREHYEALGLATLPSAHGRVSADMIRRYTEAKGGSPVVVRSASGKKAAGRGKAAVKATAK